MTDQQLKNIDMWAAQDLAPGECEEIQTLTDTVRGLQTANATLTAECEAMRAVTSATEAWFDDIDEPADMAVKVRIEGAMIDSVKALRALRAKTKETP